MTWTKWAFRVGGTVQGRLSGGAGTQCGQVCWVQLADGRTTCQAFRLSKHASLCCKCKTFAPQGKTRRLHHSSQPG